MEYLEHFLIDMTQRAKDLHLAERRTTLQSIDLVGELEGRKAWYFLGMSVETYAVHIGLTPSKYWKRARVARMFESFPEARAIYEAGETEVSHLALVAGRITEANSEVLLNGIKGKSKREVEAFVSRVAHNGTIMEERPTYDISVRLDEDQFKLLSRARDVLAHGGSVPSHADIFAEALEILLEKKDPLRKAKRAAARAEKAVASEEPIVSPGKVEPLTHAENGPEIKSKSPGAETTLGHPGRTPIPAAAKHAVWIRDEGRCAFVNPDGARCGSEMMLECDHVEMVCRGGTNAVSNLRLICRYHNDFAARQALGADYRDRYVPKYGSGEKKEGRMIRPSTSEITVS